MGTLEEAHPPTVTLEGVHRETKEPELASPMIRRLLQSNLILRLLLTRKYRWVLLAIALDIVYFLIGLITAITTNSLTSFLQYRQFYVLLFAILAAVAAAGWYPSIMVEVLAAVPRTFEVDAKQVYKLVEKWVRYLWFPLPLTFGIICSVVVIYLAVHGGLREVEANVPPLIINYRIILTFLCGVMLGGGVYVFLATLLLLRSLFSFKLRLASYRNLYPLSTLSTTLTIFAFFALALAILMIFDRFTILSVIGLLLGIIGALLMFIIPQLSYQGAVGRAKTELLSQVGDLYDKYFQVIKNYSGDPIDLSKSLVEAKQAIEALDVFEKSIRAIPNWLIEISDLQRIILSALAPISSILLNELISKLFA